MSMATATSWRHGKKVRCLLQCEGSFMAHRCTSHLRRLIVAFGGLCCKTQKRGDVTKFRGRYPLAQNDYSAMHMRSVKSFEDSRLEIGSSHVTSHIVSVRRISDPENFSRHLLKEFCNTIGA